MGERKELIRVALGKEPASLVVKNGTLVNVYSGELLEGFSVAIKGDKIAYVGKEIDHTIGKETEIIDASKKIVAPGFIDGHFHLFFSLDEFLKYSIPSGTTTAFIELELGYYFGYEAALAELENMKGQPINLFGLATIYVSPPPFLKQEKPALSTKDYERLLAKDSVVALGECYWTSVLDENKDFLTNITTALSKGKQVEGHGSGAKGRKLAAFAASGVSSCHESINVSDVLEKLRLGLHVMIREGSIRRDLEAISEVSKRGIDFRRLCLVTDGLNGEDLMSLGHMDFIVQKAINLGIDPVKAIQMATLNTAEHFGLDHMIGGIAPGRSADIVILPSLTEITCEAVISKGKVVAREGKILLHPRECTYPEALLKSIHIPDAVRPEQFKVMTKGTKGEVLVRVIRLISELITEEKQVRLRVVGGNLLPDPDQDVLKVAVIDRKNNTGKVFNGFVQGFGLNSGAFASSYSWAKGSPLVIVGTNEQDMAAAANRIIELQGGLVVADKGEIKAEVPFPIGGNNPRGPLEKVTSAFKEMNQTLKQMGCTLTDPFLTLQTTAGVSLPFFRITTHGYLDLKKRKAVGLIVE